MLFKTDLLHHHNGKIKLECVLQIEYPLGGSSKKCSHVYMYFLLQVFWVTRLFCQIVLLFDINVVLMLPWWPDVTIIQSDITIVVTWQLSTGSIHDYLFVTASWWVFYLRYWESQGTSTHFDLFCEMLFSHDFLLKLSWQLWMFLCQLGQLQWQSIGIQTVAS